MSRGAESREPPEMVALEGAEFWMGSDADAARDDERPAHRVDVASFSIGRTAVTNRQYALFAAETGALPAAMCADPHFDHPDQPVVAVSWFDAFGYCEWLSRRAGARYRLPTEAEREYACRAGSAAAYPWGDQPGRELGEYGRRWALGGPEIVGGPPNAFGLLNMADNIHEWCLDWYGAGYYPAAPRRDPRGPASGARRASRGGSWRHQVKVTRSSARSALDPSFKYTDYGFRVARSL